MYHFIYFTTTMKGKALDELNLATVYLKRGISAREI